MKKLVIIIFFGIFLLIKNSFASVINQEVEAAKSTIKDTALATKYIFTNPITAKKRIDDALARIESECCEDNFEYISEIKEIKESLLNCLEKKCQNFILPIYKKEKPPLKVVVLKQIVVLDDLFIENDKQKYENLVQQLEKDKNKQKIKNENDIKIVKEQVKNLEKENIKLKSTVDKMLSSYQKKIKDLKTENKRLTDNFNTVFEAHSKNKQKKLKETLK